MAIRPAIATLVLLFTFSCNSGREKPVSPVIPGKKELADLNRYFVQKDRERIESYIERRGLKMTESATGMWYGIKTGDSGNVFKEDDKIIFDYECSLLDGTICYRSSEIGQKEVILGKTKIEAGLDQGLRMLKPGDQAVFIIPPFLAYGLTGDGRKIPAKAVIIYEVKNIWRGN